MPTVPQNLSVGEVEPHGIGSVPAIAIAAFCETSEVAETIERAGLDRRMSRARLETGLGGIDAAIERYRTSNSPDLLILETRMGEEALFAGLARLSEVCLPNSKVIFIGHRNDVALYRELLASGVSDYLVAPLNVMDIVSATTRLYSGAANQKLGRTVAFIGARGGAGSSVVAHNTAWAVANRLQIDVLLADLDLAFGTAGLDLNLDPGQQGVADAIENVERLDQALLDRLVTSRSDRLNILTSPAALDRRLDLTETGFERLLEMAHARSGFALLDLPHSWTHWTRKILAAADDVVITVTPDLASLRNAKALLAYLGQTRPNDTPPKLVLNQIGVPKRPEIKPAQFAEAVGMELSACLVFDPSLFGAAANSGRMVDQIGRGTKPAAAFVQLAQELAGHRRVTRGHTGSAGIVARLRGKQ